MSKAFLFLRCQVHASAGALTVSVPSGSLMREGRGAQNLLWGDPINPPAHTDVQCAPGKPQQLDGTKEYPREKPYPHGAKFIFHGASQYARVPTTEGWALWVQADVRSPGSDAVMVVSPEPSRYPPGDGGPVNGPHMPWP
jgi:hypothetical protein